ncbi:MAG: cellulase family glycosylhydrolase [Oligoflexia bacterium]|nr:cellulase family glycosylhydrolase [Oligoflexia bacterium]MBF0364046.1 cellulase family glycosylhydrolase [Oligoflexia bacterium]
MKLKKISVFLVDINRRWIMTLSLVSLFLWWPASTTLANTHLMTKGGQFVDAQGAVVVLRGVNVAGNSKVPPFLTINNGAELDPLKHWGFNVIRLLFIWEAFEPERGHYNLDYLEGYAKIVEWAHERQIYTIIDIHQDAFSRYQQNGCGDGFPRWAVPPSITADTPDNGKNCKNWGVNMLLDMDMHNSWHHFYRNTYGVRDRYLQMLSKLAAHFTNHPGVIGYDLLNEPMGWERTEILPLYEDAEAAVRAKDASAIIFLCPHALVSSGINSLLEKPKFGNVVYAPHYYSASVMSIGTWLGFSTDSVFKRMASKAREWNAPLLIGEFGAPARTRRVESYMDALYSSLDQHLASGTQWNYTPGWNEHDYDGWNGEDLSIVDDRGQPRANFVPRAYPQRITGSDISFVATVSRNNQQAAEVTLSWDHQVGIGETKLFVPRSELFGQHAIAVETTGEQLACSFDTEERYVTCTSDVPGKKSLHIHVVP